MASRRHAENTPRHYAIDNIDITYGFLSYAIADCHAAAIRYADNTPLSFH
jgi:hypothetical protein